MANCLSILPYFMWNQITCYLNMTDACKLGAYEELACILKDSDWKRYFFAFVAKHIVIISYSSKIANCVNNRLKDFWRYACCSHTIISVDTDKIGNVFELIELDSKTNPGLIYKVFIGRGNFNIDSSAGNIKKSDYNYDCNRAYRIDFIGSKTDKTVIDMIQCIRKYNRIHIVMPRYFSISHIAWNDFMLTCSSFFDNEDNVKLSRNNIFNNCGDWMMNYFHE